MILVGLFQLQIFRGSVIWICVTLGSFVHSGKCKPCIQCLKVQSLHFQYLKYLVLYKVNPTAILKMFTMNRKYSQQCDFSEVIRDLHCHKQDHNLVLCPFTTGFYKVEIKSEDLYSVIIKPDKLEILLLQSDFGTT